MYFDAADGKTADADGIITLSTQAPIRKVLASSKANQTVNIYMSKDKAQWDKVSGARFDENGEWLNNKSIQDYGYIAFEPNIDGSISALAEISAEDVLELPLKTTLHLYPKSGDVKDASAFAWTTDREDVATVTNGEVNLLRKGNVTIKATKESTSFTCKISVIGEIEAAIKNNTVAEYILSVKPVFNEINRAIKEKDADGLEDVFKNTGSVKIESIVDIDAQKVADLDSDNSDETDKLDAFISRIMTYENFPCEDTKDVYYLADVIDMEYAVGLLDDLTDYTQMISDLEVQNVYLGLDLENAYYKKYKNDAATRLCSDEFTNADDLKYKYKQAYVMAGLKNALSPDMVEKLLSDCENEIDYDKTHFDNVKSVALYKAIIEEKSKLNDLEKLRDFIDEYTKPKEPAGIGLGGGGGGVNRPAMSINVDNETVNEINQETLATPEPIITFPDLEEGHWAYEGVMTLKAKNIINGYEDGFFRPDNIVNRAEFVKMLMLALNIDADEATEVTAFSDVNSDAWYYDVVMLAAQYKIISGYTDGSFRPDAIVTREEMATMLYRAYAEHIAEISKDGAEVEYTDADKISDWAAEAVKALSDSGILSGDENLMFEPTRGATRAETAKCISALL